MHLGQQVLFPCSVKMGCNESRSTIPRLATIFIWAASVTFPCFVNGGKWFRKIIYDLAVLKKHLLRVSLLPRQLEMRMVTIRHTAI